MKRYYDLNGSGSKDYDPVARRNGGEPDFGFAEKMITRADKHDKYEKIEKISPSHEKERAEKPIRISKSKNNEKNMRSCSPTLRKELKPLSSSKDKQLNSSNEKDTENEIKSLYKQLQEIKTLAGLDNSKENSSDKILKKILEHTNQALSNKLFSKEKKKLTAKQDVGKHFIHIIMINN